MDAYIDELIANAVELPPPTPALPPRKGPGWYLRGQLGVFIHWGVYSVPGYNSPTKTPRKLANGSEWYARRLKNSFLYGVGTREFHKHAYGENTTYRDLAPNFTVDAFDADAWVASFAAAGATYLVITAKHHDGFCLWPVTPALRAPADRNWNSMDVGPKRDLIGELEAAARRHGLAFGIYYSLLEWDNGRYASDRARASQGKPPAQHYASCEALPQLKELVLKYHPDLLWLDGDWEMSRNYWNGDAFRAWLDENAPLCVTNDRWGKGCHGTYGDIHTHSDRYIPAVAPPHKWESCMTIGESWGIDKTMARRKGHAALLDWAARTINLGGNALLNVGPDAAGTIPPADLAALGAVGAGLRARGLI